MVGTVRSVLLVGRGFEVTERIELASRRYSEPDDADVSDAMDNQCSEIFYAVAAKVRLYSSEWIINGQGMVMKKEAKEIETRVTEASSKDGRKNDDANTPNGRPSVSIGIDMNIDGDININRSENAAMQDAMYEDEPIVSVHSPLPLEKDEEDKVDAQNEQHSEEMVLLDDGGRQGCGLKLVADPVRPIESFGCFHHSTKLLLFSNYELPVGEFDDLLNGNGGNGSSAKSTRDAGPGDSDGMHDGNCELRK